MTTETLSDTERREAWRAITRELTTLPDWERGWCLVPKVEIRPGRVLVAFHESLAHLATPTRERAVADAAGRALPHLWDGVWIARVRVDRTPMITSAGSYGEAVRRVRKAAGLSQGKIAGKMGWPDFDQSRLSRIERGISRPVSKPKRASLYMILDISDDEIQAIEALLKPPTEPVKTAHALVKTAPDPPELAQITIQIPRELETRIRRLADREYRTAEGQIAWILVQRFPAVHAALFGTIDVASG